MRILRFLFNSALILVIVTVVGGLIGREVMLLLGMAKLRSAISTMRKLSLESGSLAARCERESGAISGPALSRIELVFTSDTEFQVQAVCSSSFVEPQVMEKGTLPMLVQKLPGSSGLVWGDETMRVGLTVLGRQRAVGIVNQLAVYESTEVVLAGMGPITSCQGYGYSCCQEETSIGQGTGITTATDCPRSCFASCQARPVVLSFATDPYFDPQTRELKITSGTSVAFLYVANVPAERQATITLDYGDGQQETLSTLEGNVVHTYMCADSCSYTAKLSLVDDQGVAAVQTPVSTVRVLVGP